MPSRRIMILNRKAPHGEVSPQESLEMALMAAAFDHEVHVVFADDGVFQLTRNQKPKAIGRKDFARGFGALEDHGAKALYAERESLALRGLRPDLLVLPATLLDRDALATMMEEMDVILTT